MVNAAIIAFVGITFLIINYFLYGKFIEKKIKPTNRKTPAFINKDKVDFYPANKFFLFGHHFASIAGVGPIVGPILGAVYGWLPALLWIFFGNIFIGAVHDFTSLVVSMRKKGKTIGTIVEDYLGKEGKKVFLIFTWFTLILVIAVFDMVVAKTFNKHPEAATASMLFILIAIFFGYFLYKKRVNILFLTVIGVLLLFLSIWIGFKYPLELTYNTWIVILLLYVFIAAITPVWILLQPRDYLNSFLLYIILLGGVIGIFLYKPHVEIKVFTGFYNERIGWLFPMVFVTIACGAISGFHSLVSSGTSSKQIEKESDSIFIGYGSMLLEGVLATVALITAIMLTQNNYLKILIDAGPVSMFSLGIGKFLAKLNIPEKIGISFAALTISAFALTTLDTSTRIARYTFQEFFSDFKGEKILSNKFLATVITIFLAGILAFNKGGVKAVWPLFGAANQMLAALALLTVTLYLSRNSIKNNFTKIPAIIMFIITISATVAIMMKNIKITNLN